jgi:hypothetical protein
MYGAPKRHRSAPGARAALQTDGYLMHFHEPGDDFFIDLRFKRVAP